MSEIFKLDGSIGEGGGSILRVAAATACCIQKGIHISQIRTNRKNPGLKTQHLVGILALKQLTQGTVSSVGIGSTDLEFIPGFERIPKFSFEIRTAGSVSLLVQTLQNALIIPRATHPQYEFDIIGGGTYVMGAPGTSYIDNVLFHLFQRMGYECHLKIQRHGYYPKGGARSTLIIKPQMDVKNYRPFHCIERGDLVGVNIIIHAHQNLKKAQVAERICKTICDNLSPEINNSDLINCQQKYHNSLSVGVGVDGWMEFSTGIRIGIGTHLGKRGLSSEELGRRVSRELNSLYQSSYTVDPHAADQILPILLLSQQNFSFTVPKITSHFRTNVEILERLLQKRPKIVPQADQFLISNS